MKVINKNKIYFSSRFNLKHVKFDYFTVNWSVEYILVYYELCIFICDTDSVNYSDITTNWPRFHELDRQFIKRYHDFNENIQ